MAAPQANVERHTQFTVRAVCRSQTLCPGRAEPQRRKRSGKPDVSQVAVTAVAAVTGNSKIKEDRPNVYQSPNPIWRCCCWCSQRSLHAVPFRSGQFPEPYRHVRVCVRPGQRRGHHRAIFRAEDSESPRRPSSLRTRPARPAISRLNMWSAPGRTATRLCSWRHYRCREQ